MSAAGSRGAESPRLALGWAAAAPALTQSRGWHPRSRGIAPADRSRGIAPADPRKQNRPPRSEETFRLKSSGASTARRRRARGGDEAAPSPSRLRASRTQGTALWAVPGKGCTAGRAIKPTDSGKFLWPTSEERAQNQPGLYTPRPRPAPRPAAPRTTPATEPSAPRGRTRRRPPWGAGSTGRPRAVPSHERRLTRE